VIRAIVSIVVCRRKAIWQGKWVGRTFVSLCESAPIEIGGSHPALDTNKMAFGLIPMSPPLRGNGSSLCRKWHTLLQTTISDANGSILNFTIDPYTTYVDRKLDNEADYSSGPLQNDHNHPQLDKDVLLPILKPLPSKSSFSSGPTTFPHSFWSQRAYTW